VPDYSYEIDSKLDLWLLKKGADMDVWFYQGNSRSNLTELFENGEQPVSGGGAPVEVNVSDSATIIVAPGRSGGNLTIAFRVSGQPYSWWQQPFLGEPLWAYYLGVSSVSFGVFLILALPVFLGINLCCACMTGTTYGVKKL
jgi:hypothetical protein